LEAGVIARTDQNLPVPVGTFIEFEIERPVASSKNRRRIFARGRRVVSLPSEQAEADFALLRGAAREAAGGLQFGADDALRIEYQHDLDSGSLWVRVTKIGTLPTKGPRGTKRDVHGMLETIADALQGVLYPNDSAIDTFSGGRVRTTTEGKP
jgi:hypothetical protein